MKRYNPNFDKKFYWILFGTLAILYILSLGSRKQNYTKVWVPNMQFNRTFVVVTGAEGSGTGFFALNLGILKPVLSFGKLNLGKLSNTIFVPEHGEFEPFHNLSFPLFEKRNRVWNSFSAANHIMWGPGPLKEVRNAKSIFPQLLDHMFTKVYPNKEILFCHRSSPDYDSLHYPDISQDLIDMVESVGYNLKILVSYRDPMGSAYSKYRRNFTHIIPPGESKADLYYSARSVEMHLTLLNSQLSLLPPSYYTVLSFDKFLENPMPAIQQLSDFLGISEENLQSVLLNSKKKPSNLRNNLTEEDVHFLESFFSIQRLKQWHMLDSSRL